MPSEAILTRQFGVSRTVTREAMRSLQTLGLVEVSRGRRPRVKIPCTNTTIGSIHLHLQLSRSTLLQQLEVRTAIECTTVELASLRRTPQSIRDLKNATDELFAAETQEQYVDADLKFHRILAIATGNVLFETVLGALGELMRQSMRAQKDEPSKKLMNQIHLDIRNKVTKGDSVGARHAMLRHMEFAKTILIEVIG